MMLKAVLLLFFGGLALAFGQGHWPHGVAIVVGIACVTRSFRLMRPVMSVPLFILVHVLVWEWAYAGMVPLPAPARIGMEFATSSALTLVFLADRFVARRVQSLAGTLVLPCGWVAFDLASARVSPGGTWGSIAYSFADAIVIVQIASIVGWTGLTFLAAWLGSLVNWAWDRRGDDRGRARAGLLTGGLVVIVVFAVGVVRLVTSPTGRPLSVACVIAPNIFDDESLDALWAYTRGVERPADSVTMAQRRINESMEDHFARVERAADDGATLVVWPEANPVMTSSEEGDWVDRARSVARRRAIFIGMGMVVFRPATFEPALNKFVVVDPSGAVVIDFLKATRVPGTQFAEGAGMLPVVETGIGNITSAICFDLDFPHLIRQAGLADADLLLAPSNDWFEAAATHARMARLRAVEQGLTLIRPTKDGVSLVTDSSGRARGVLELLDNQTGSLVTDVSVGARRTVYAVIGDAFAWACCLILVVLLAGATRLQESTV